MKAIWNFFEEMNEFVYVSDIENNELVYMNKKTRELFGFHSIEEVVGKKCYEVLHGCNAPCAICNNYELTTGHFKEWKYYNPTIKKSFELKDTVLEENGRRYRMELAIDVSAQERQSNILSNYQNLEVLANEALRIALQAETPDKSIDIILEYIGKALNGERTYVFEQNKEGGDDNTYEWVASGVTPEKENLQNLPSEVCANWYRNFSEDKNITIEDLEEIRETDPLQYENLKRQNIHSLVVVPLYNDKKIIGFYGVDNPPGKTLDYVQNMLQIMGHFIISCIKRRNLLNKLRDMSYSDPLTGFGNRFAMEKYIKEMQENGKIGVVYCDITGLKRTNDTEGHTAGDRLILRACDSLERVFGEYGLFRIGGDELLALCPQIEEDELNNRVELLKKDMEKSYVTIAIGVVWQKEGRTDIDMLLSESEKRMYAEKTAYYKASGLDRRR